ncbi:hypothetical protein [Sphingomonas sp. CFBP 13720]|uniref:hypothetical protein n=1 Tax=Sphingomonas sp. CFBP 13720 TaxID=2775302 RepID=UPI0017847991|nr:hypothetical protein [Sphingomonas sp. CFBP 13720]MBD8677933.1 hypothetical protein [Sphingomonas sp. CFBP 13720]
MVFIRTRGGRGSSAPFTYVPSLNDLVLSGALVAGVPSSGTILNATTGSTIASAVPGLTVNSAARTYSYNGTGAVGAVQGLTETLAGATFSPRNNVVTLVSASVAAFTSNPSISPTSGNVGATFSAIDGAMSNGGQVLGRRWLLNGTSIGTGTTVVPVVQGSLVLENTGTGNVVATSPAVTVSATTGPTPEPTLKPLIWTNLQRVGFETSTITVDRRYRQRSLHLTGFVASRFRLAIPSWGKPGGESVTPVAFTIEKAAVEINGGYIPVTFGGSPSGVVDPAVDLLFSDWIDTSKLVGGTPLGANFPRDAEIYVRIKAILPTGVIVQRGTLSRSQGQTNQFYDPADEALTSDVYGVGSFTGSPPSATIPTGGSGMSLFIIGDPVAAGAKAALAAGDSIMYGAADSAWGSQGLANKVGFGAWDRATADSDGKNVLPLLHMSQPGEKQDQWMSRINRGKSILPFVNIALDEFGTNDIGGTNSTSRTLDQMKTTRLAFWKLMRDNGIEKILTTTLPPRVVGQGADYSTPEGQTYVTSRWAPGGQKDLFEQWIATQVGVAGGTDVFADIYAPVKAAADPFKWAGPFTSDGCHPLSSGHIRMAVPLRAAWLALPVNGVATAPAGPTNSAPPAIAGTPEVGQTLTRTTAGTYSATPTSVEGQWRRDSNPIAGATGTTYVVTSADAGALGIDYQEKATFSSGTVVSAASNPLGPVTAAGAPENTVRPTITGTAEVGKVLTVSDGTWTNSPTGYAYQWRAETVVIVGATSKTYTPTTSEQDKVIDCEVTATNAAGARTRLSTSVGPVVAAAGGTPSGTVLFLDTFTADPAATADPGIGGSRKSDSGHTWGRNAAIGVSGAAMQIDRAGGFTITSTVPVEFEVVDFVASSPDYNVKADFNRRSSLTTNAMFLFRRMAGADRGYGVMYSNSAAEWRLYRFPGGGVAGAIVGAYAAAIPTGTGVAEAQARGSRIVVLVDGVSRIDFTDPDPILEAGTIGHRLSGNGATAVGGVSLSRLEVTAA